MNDEAELQMDPVPAMLAMLIDAAGSAANAGCLLHESVVLTRLDGVEIRGRDAVVDAVANRGSDARLRTVAHVERGIEVALEVPGVDGYFLFTMIAAVRDGLLIEITMR